MRKLMNKKGFSLVELMIVVVIMGILIAVAIPLYGAITTNANNKTCATNIKTIKTAAANYYASYDQTAIGSEADLLGLMEDKTNLPKCPVGDDYGIYISKSTGAATVICNGTDDGHTPAENGSATAIPSGNDVIVVKAATSAPAAPEENG